MQNNFDRLGLTANPFEPAATGAPLTDLWVPKSWSDRLAELLTLVGSGQGAKAIALAGAYGSGKSYVLPQTGARGATRKAN